MALSNLFCARNTRNMVVKIVYPGGRVELHDRPILAAEIMQQNPKCCVTHPDVFRQPWAVISPDTVLLLGQKFYVVPVSTLRKLQRNPRRNRNSSRARVSSPSLTPKPQLPLDSNKDGPKDAACLIFDCLKENESVASSSAASGGVSTHEMERGKHQLDDGCFKSLLASSKPRMEQAASDSMGSGPDDPSEFKEIKKKRAKNKREKEKRNSPNRGEMKSPSTPTYYCWQPRLENISEE